MGEADLVECGVDALAQFDLRNLAGVQAVGDVVESRFVGEQSVILKDHADVAVVGRDVRHVVLVEQDAPAIAVVEAGNAAQQGGLAAAARAEQREKGAVGDVQR